MSAALAAAVGSLGAAAFLLVFLWGASTWACDVGAALHVALPFDSGHAHNSEQHAGLEGSLAQGVILTQRSCPYAREAMSCLRSRVCLNGGGAYDQLPRLVGSGAQTRSQACILLRRPVAVIHSVFTAKQHANLVPVAASRAHTSIDHSGNYKSCSDTTEAKCQDAK